MKTLIIILALAFTVSAQDFKEIKEMSGYIPNYPNLTVKTSAAEIARGDDVIKLLLKIEFPEGAPVQLLKDNVPFGFDVSSISRIEFKTVLNCDTLTVKMVNNSGAVYQFNGKRHKSKEPPFGIDAGNIFVRYFCERGEKPTIAPTLKP